jgi:TRAP-type C4-dicarboxylate transport system permease small subunit
VRTPALEISNTWRAAAVLVGAVLLALSAALRFVLLPAAARRSGRGRGVLIAGAMVLAKPMFMAFGN